MPYLICADCKAGHCDLQFSDPKIITNQWCEFFVGWVDIDKHKPPSYQDLVVKDAKGKAHVAFFSPGWDAGCVHKTQLFMDSNTGEKIENPVKWLKGIGL